MVERENVVVVADAAARVWLLLVNTLTQLQLVGDVASSWVGDEVELFVSPAAFGGSLTMLSLFCFWNDIWEKQLTNESMDTVQVLTLKWTRYVGEREIKQKDVVPGTVMQGE